MARTYRLRHLPRMRAKKFIDGGCNWRHRHILEDAFIDAEVARIVPEKVVRRELPGHTYSYRWHESGVFHEEARQVIWLIPTKETLKFFRWRTSVRMQIEKQLIHPVMQPYFHPWAGRHMGRSKRWEKHQRARLFRKHEKMLLKDHARARNVPNRNRDLNPEFRDRKEFCDSWYYD